MSIQLNIQVLQHVPFEDIGEIKTWVQKHGHNLHYTKFYENEYAFPQPEKTDLLIIMGGPMGVNDTEQYPWIKEEIGFIKQIVNADKPILGICLGAQMLASALGAKVYKGKEAEIGWFPLHFHSGVRGILAQNIPGLVTFHWHGETFDLPHDAECLASSAITPNQGFIYNKKVLALQFHPEMNSTSLETMIQHCGHELAPGNFVQMPDEMRMGLDYQYENHQLIFKILDYLVQL